MSDRPEHRDSIYLHFHERRVGIAMVPLSQMSGLTHEMQRELDNEHIENLIRRFGVDGGARMTELMYIVPNRPLPSAFESKLREGKVIPSNEVPKDLQFYILDGRHRAQAALRWLQKMEINMLRIDGNGGVGPGFDGWRCGDHEVPFDPYSWGCHILDPRFGDHPDLQGWMDHINTEKFLLQHTFSRKMQILSKYSPDQIQSVVSGWALGERDRKVWSVTPKTVLWPALVDLARIPFYGRHLSVSMVYDWFEFSPIFEIFGFILGDATKQIARIEKAVDSLNGDSPIPFTLHPENIYGTFYRKHCQGEYNDFLEVARSANVKKLVLALNFSTYEEWWNWAVTPEDSNLLGDKGYVYGARLITPHALDMSLNQGLCKLLRQVKAAMSFMWIFLKPDDVSIKYRKRSPWNGARDPWSVYLAPLLGDGLSNEKKSVACRKLFLTILRDGNSLCVPQIDKSSEPHTNLENPFDGGSLRDVLKHCTGFFIQWNETLTFVEGLGWRRNERVWGIYKDVVAKTIKKAKAEVMVAREREAKEKSLAELLEQIKRNALGLRQGSMQPLGGLRINNASPSVVLPSAGNREEVQSVDDREPEIKAGNAGTASVPIVRPKTRKGTSGVKRRKEELSSDDDFVEDICRSDNDIDSKTMVSRFETNVTISGSSSRSRSNAVKSLSSDLLRVSSAIQKAYQLGEGVGEQFALCNMQMHLKMVHCSDERRERIRKYMNLTLQALGSEETVEEDDELVE